MVKFELLKIGLVGDLCVIFRGALNFLDTISA